MKYLQHFRITLIALIALTSISLQAQDAAFDVNNIASAVVKLQNLEANVAPQTGVFVTPHGLIITSNDDEGFYLDEEIEVSAYISLDQQPEPSYLGTVVATDDVLAVIRITHDLEGNELDLSTLDLPHYNPIERTVTIELLETVFAVSYSEVGGGYITTTQGAVNGFDKVPNFVSGDLLEEVMYYQSDVTIDVQGLGSPVVTFSGDFVGIAVELPIDSRGALTDDVLVQIAPVTTLCITIRDICNEIMEGYRPHPEDRTSRPSQQYWLTDGIGLTTNAVVPRGEIEVEYYCTMLGLRARTDEEETVWQCYSPRDNETKYELTSFDYDIICQQTYRNPVAIAIQDGSSFLSPAYQWRCYG